MQNLKRKKKKNGRKKKGGKFGGMAKRAARKFNDDGWMRVVWVGSTAAGGAPRGTPEAGCPLGGGEAPEKLLKSSCNLAGGDLTVDMHRLSVHDKSVHHLGCATRQSRSC